MTKEVIFIIVGALVLALLIVLLCCLIKRSKNKKVNTKTTKVEEQITEENNVTKEEKLEEKQVEEVAIVEETTEEVEEQPQEKASKLKGKFIYYKTAKGFYNYRLKASNNETIAVSGGTGYKSLTGCKSGIESLRKNVNAPIEDQTLKTYDILPKPKFELYLDKAEKYRYRLIAKNGEIICVSEGGYATKLSCKKGIQSLAKWAPNSDVVKED